jgi:hypothetical protein
VPSRSGHLGRFGSHERALPLFEKTVDEPADVFWSVFLSDVAAQAEKVSFRVGVPAAGWQT